MHKNCGRSQNINLLVVYIRKILNRIYYINKFAHQPMYTAITATSSIAPEFLFRDFTRAEIESIGKKSLFTIVRAN